MRGWMDVWNEEANEQRNEDHRLEHARVAIFLFNHSEFHEKNDFRNKQKSESARNVNLNSKSKSIR